MPLAMILGRSEIQTLNLRLVLTAWDQESIELEEDLSCYAQSPDLIVLSNPPTLRTVRKLRRQGCTAPLVHFGSATVSGVTSFPQGMPSEDVARAITKLCTPLTVVQIQPGTRMVLIDGREHHLTETSCALLAHLAGRRGTWIPSGELLRVAFEAHHDHTSSIVRVHVHSLRKALGPRRHLVESQRGRGYRLTLASTAQEPTASLPTR